MKKIWTIVIIALALHFLSPPVSAYYYSVGTGAGGSADERNLTLEIGKIDIDRYGKKFLLGIGVPFLLHGADELPADILDTPCPANVQCSSLGDIEEGTEKGLLGKVGVAVFNPKLYLSVIGGVTWYDQVQVTQSNTTSQHYKQASNKETASIYGLSIGYFPELFEWKLKMSFQIDYDNRRGTTFFVGCHW